MANRYFSDSLGRWIYHADLSAADTTGRVYIPVDTRSKRDTTLAVEPSGGGVGFVEYTTSPPPEVEHDNAIWREWDNGPIDETTPAHGRDDRLSGNITAFRVTNVGAGNVRVEVQV